MKIILGIIEIEFIENLYNTGLTDQKTILYKYWKNIKCIFIKSKNICYLYVMDAMFHLLISIHPQDHK